MSKKSTKQSKPEDKNPQESQAPQETHESQTQTPPTEQAVPETPPASQQALQQPQPQMQQPVGQPAPAASDSDHTLRLIAFIFAIIGTSTAGLVAIVQLIGIMIAALAGNPLIGVFFLFFCAPLAWMIPMTVRSFKIYKGEQPNTTSFGICSLLFLNLISGILLLCSKKDA